MILSNFTIGLPVFIVVSTAGDVPDSVCVCCVFCADVRSIDVEPIQKPYKPVSLKLPRFGKREREKNLLRTNVGSIETVKQRKKHRLTFV